MVQRDTHRTEPESPEFAVCDLRRTVGGRVLHADLSFSVPSGGVLFIQGPSGVGKTVLLRSLAALDPIDSGSITLEGKTPDAWGLPQWRSLVTYVHQQRVVLPGTPAEFFERVKNLGTQKNRPKGDLKAIAESLGLEDGVIDQPWQELSGGQAQRVALAVVLALKPKVLLVDEPTSSLDGESVLRVEKALKESDSTVIWVSHSPDQLKRVGGRVLELPEGRVYDI